MRPLIHYHQEAQQLARDPQASTVWLVLTKRHHRQAKLIRYTGAGYQGGPDDPDDADTEDPLSDLDYAVRVLGTVPCGLILFFRDGEYVNGTATLGAGIRCFEETAKNPRAHRMLEHLVDEVVAASWGKG
jgi:hypothetical protein